MKTQLIGVTGGIGSGKSYVCNLFKILFGIEVLNTDQMVQSDILRREHVKRQIIAKFGDDSYLEDGPLNKEKFRNLIKTDTYARLCAHYVNDNRKINDIPTPLQLINEIVCPELRKEITLWGEYPRGKYAFVECAVIYENGLEDLFDNVILVTCPLNIRCERLEKRGLDKDMIDVMICNQFNDADKLAKAKLVIENNVDVENRVEQVHKLLEFWV